MNKENKFFKENKLAIKIHEFKNMYGEKFVIYRYLELPTYYFITGDEFSWEESWQVDLKNGIVYRRFLTSPEETNKIIQFGKEYTRKF